MADTKPTVSNSSKRLANYTHDIDKHKNSTIAYTSGVFFQRPLYSDSRLVKWAGLALTQDREFNTTSA